MLVSRPQIRQSALVSSKLRQKLLLRSSPLGHIAGDFGEADQLAIRVIDCIDDSKGPEPGTILADAPALGLDAPILGRFNEELVGRLRFSGGKNIRKC